MDEAVAVSDDEAQLMRSRLAKEEGLHVGYTAAANVVAALSVAASLPQDTIVATILCDTGMKYED